MMLNVNLVGNGAILFALVACIIGVFCTFLGHIGQREDLKRPVFWAAYSTFFAMSLANLVMIYALLTNDFSVSYVSHVGARETPRFFAAISLWSSLEGSILLWGWVLSGYTALCAYRYRDRFAETMPWVITTLLIIGAFFYVVLAIPANPFVPVFPIPENGPGPNPLLQNHWLMALHPPMLYLGYVGMSVPFAFAVASMVSGQLTDTWMAITRRWTLAAWMFLSAAIVLGGWWSYEVLGWGGYWAWDPVENASFMPWLTATAFLHSIMVQEKRQMLKVWNLCLIVTTFLLTILGTFLTRSGVLESVHSFTQSDIGHYFLIFIAIALTASTALLIWKSPQFRSEGRLDHPLSRETFFLLNNLLFVCFCFVVLLGTLYPLIVEALRGIKVSVGEPFFDQMTTPLCIGLILLMGLGSAVPWKKADPASLLRFFRVPVLLGISSVFVGYFFGIRFPKAMITIGVSVFSFSVMFIEMFWIGWKLRSPIRLFQFNPRRYGGFVVHIGAILIAVGVALSGSYQEEKQVTLKEGEKTSIGPYELEFQELLGREKPQRFEVMAKIKVGNDFLYPQLNYYSQSREPVGTPAVRSTLVRDLYLTLMAFDPKKKEASLRLIVTPAVSWIWIGAGVIVMGTWISLREKRRE